MRKILVTAAAVSALLLSGVSVAHAADPTCGEAISSLTEARAAANDSQSKLDAAEKTQKPLDDAVAAAEKALAALPANDPGIPAAAAALAKAKSDAAVGQAKVDAAKTADTAADAKVVTAQAGVTKACGSNPPVVEDPPADQRVCADFGTNKAAAQAAFLAGNTKLDGDADGIACDEQIVKKPTVAPATGGA